ncbi:MAG TPA: SDR family oxidoreductase [candidate division Zixibacteria bacterium]|nr:SDR family oxidoreductase [candidate division Zixibacteria bacterium]
MLQLDLTGKVAVVSGGSRGIGAACVRMFAKAGARVVFSYQKSADRAARLVEELGPNTFAAQADLNGTTGGEQKLIHAAVERFGSVDALVVNHGVWPAHDEPIDTMTEAQWRNTIATNLDSAFLLVKHAVAQMKQQPEGGNVVLIASTAAQRGEAYHCDYAASKGALVSMVKGLSTELASAKIRVNCVAPGWVETEMSAPVLAQPEVQANILRVIPLGRVGRPEEIAAPVVFLCTAHAGFITGEIFNVNGGAVLVG